MSGNAVIKGRAAELVALLQQCGLTVATAESCTGGSVAAAITSVPGCSSVMLGGVVAYHNRVKAKVLGVDEVLLEAFGAVSEPVVREMVAGVAALTGADCAVATSGVAGPGGGTQEKPVGTVWIGVATPHRSFAVLKNCGTDRGQIIQRATAYAIRLLLDELQND